MQGELNFLTNFPSKETLKLLLELHALNSEMKSEQKRMSLISEETAEQLLGIPPRKLHQYAKEGFLKVGPDGKFSKYYVIKLLFEMKQEELFDSMK
jgi:hypothetical protein